MQQFVLFPSFFESCTILRKRSSTICQVVFRTSTPLIELSQDESTQNQVRETREALTEIVEPRNKKNAHTVDCYTQNSRMIAQEGENTIGNWNGTRHLNWELNDQTREFPSKRRACLSVCHQHSTPKSFSSLRHRSRTKHTVPNRCHGQNRPSPWSRIF